jgi:hypothetical protein
MITDHPLHHLDMDRTGAAALIEASPHVLQLTHVTHPHTRDAMVRQTGDRDTLISMCQVTTTLTHRGRRVRTDDHVIQMIVGGTAVTAHTTRGIHETDTGIETIGRIAGEPTETETGPEIRGTSDESDEMTGRGRGVRNDGTTETVTVTFTGDRDHTTLAMFI